MRQRGNHRLLMNANLWPEMKVTPMDGGKVTLPPPRPPPPPPKPLCSLLVYHINFQGKACQASWNPLPPPPSFPETNV